jgi:hypothetical protein
VATLVPPWTFLFVMAGAEAMAAPLPRAAVMQATAGSPELEPTAGALEQVIRIRLDQLDVVETEGTPALALDELQLALGCVGESRACLTSVALQLEVALLLLINLDAAGNEKVLTLRLFDQRDGTVKSAAHRAGGTNADPELLDAVDPLLRRLFGLPPPPPKVVAEIERRRPIPTPVIAAAGASAASLLVGVIFGAMSASSDYAALPTGTRRDVDAYLDVLGTAESRATAANVFFGISAVAAVASGAMWLWWPEDEPPALAPQIGHGTAGLAVRWSGP